MQSWRMGASEQSVGGVGCRVKLSHGVSISSFLNNKVLHTRRDSKNLQKLLSHTFLIGESPHPPRPHHPPHPPTSMLSEKRNTERVSPPPFAVGLLLLLLLLLLLMSTTSKRLRKERWEESTVA